MSAQRSRPVKRYSKPPLRCENRPDVCSDVSESKFKCTLVFKKQMVVVKCRSGHNICRTCFLERSPCVTESYEEKRCPRCGETFVGWLSFQVDKAVTKFRRAFTHSLVRIFPQFKGFALNPFKVDIVEDVPKARLKKKHDLNDPPQVSGYFPCFICDVYLPFPRYLTHLRSNHFSNLSEISAQWGWAAVAAECRFKFRTRSYNRTEFVDTVRYIFVPDFGIFCVKIKLDLKYILLTPEEERPLPLFTSEASYLPKDHLHVVAFVKMIGASSEARKFKYLLTIEAGIYNVTVQDRVLRLAKDEPSLPQNKRCMFFKACPTEVPVDCWASLTIISDPVLDQGATHREKASQFVDIKGDPQPLVPQQQFHHRGGSRGGVSRGRGGQWRKSTSHLPDKTSWRSSSANPQEDPGNRGSFRGRGTSPGRGGRGSKTRGNFRLQFGQGRGQGPAIQEEPGNQQDPSDWRSPKTPRFSVEPKEEGSWRIPKSDPKPSTSRAPDFRTPSRSPMSAERQPWRNSSSASPSIGFSGPPRFPNMAPNEARNREFRDWRSQDRSTGQHENRQKFQRQGAFPKKNR